MSADNAAFVGSIPENYDRYLGPVLFEPFAEDLVARLVVSQDAAVLELACGTGIVTRRLRDRLPETARIVATDFNEAMMNYARQKFRPDENIEWRQADASDLPFDGESFAAVICQFGLMFVPDKPKAAREALRVLKPGGKFLFSVWDAIEENDFPHTAHTTVARYFDNDPPNFYQVPFSMHDVAALRSLLTSAGFIDIQIELLPLASTAAAAGELAHGLVHGNPIITSLTERCASRIPEIEAEVAATVAAKYGDHPVRARMQALICSATRP